MATKKVRIKNVSPRGALDVPLLGQRIGAGETVLVPVNVADRLLEQPANFALVDGQAQEQE